MVWLCASTLIQVISIIMFFPSIILNVLLLTAIDYEKKNGNKYEFYNTIFRFTAHTNIAYTILLTILQPILIVSQSSVYVAILGIGSSFPILLKNFLFAIFIGLLTFKNLESPVALGLRYFNIIKKIDISKKFKPVLIVVFLLCVAATLHYFIFIYLQTQDFAPNWDSYQKSISSYTCNINNGFLVMDRIVAYYLFCEAIPLIIGFGFCVIIDIFLARHILRNNDNRSKIGYHESKNLGITLILMNITTVFLQTIPILIFSIFVILKTDVGLRAIPTLLGSYFMPLLSPAIIFYHILPYRIHLYRRFGLLKSQATVGLSQTSI
ncbi:unnamed protein product [Caenorhabditis angaria]|uniref:Uncharacterized protein n=1 Tax=Caenorhabditis angaria TaxID=860376 RepID=A0A9P1J015_9PELO|nr:unnamed protein product [Caenorhabditis angaria]